MAAPTEYMQRKYEWAVDDVQVVEPATEDGGGETASGLWPGAVQTVADDKTEETAEDTDRER